MAAAAAILVTNRSTQTPVVSDPVEASATLPGVHSADSIVRAWVDSGVVPGAVLSIVHDGSLLWERAYGYAQLDPPVAMETTTTFDLASVTKVMATTFAAMILVDRGALELDTPIRSVLEDFEGEGKEYITPRHLLTHRGGLYAWQPTYYAAEDRDAAYAYIRDLPLPWAVGEERHYSDLGFMLMGRLVETISGQTLDAFVADELYEPLGLESTGYRRNTPDAPPVRAGNFAATSRGNPFENRMVHDTAFGYRFAGDPDSWSGWRNRQLLGEVNDGNAHHAFGGVAGHAGLFSTAQDLQVLMQLLLEKRAGGDGAAGPGPLIADSVIDQFLVDSGDDQALGWQIPEYASAGSFTHTGFTGTWVLGVPDAALSVVLLTNRQNGGVDRETRYPDVGPLQIAVARALLGSTP